MRGGKGIKGKWGDHVGEGEAGPADTLVTWNRLPCSCQVSASRWAVAAVDGTWPVLPVGVCGAAGVPSQVCAGGEGSLDHPGPANPPGGGRVFQGPQLPDPTHKLVATATELRVQPERNPVPSRCQNICFSI